MLILLLFFKLTPLTCYKPCIERNFLPLFEWNPSHGLELLWPFQCCPWHVICLFIHCWKSDHLQCTLPSRLLPQSTIYHVLMASALSTVGVISKQSEFVSPCFSVISEKRFTQYEASLATSCNFTTSVFTLYSLFVFLFTQQVSFYLPASLYLLVLVLCL